jgi:cytochrome c biogenesis protein CcmG, thiol:disulfide interchange protein DsbE
MGTSQVIIGGNRPWRRPPGARERPAARQAARALVVGLALAAIGAAGEPAVPHLARGQPAPDFRVERLLGGELRLSALRGKVVVLDFWATWCPPCRAELPWLMRLARRYEARGLFLVAMNQDEGDQRLLAARFAQELPGIERYITLGGPAVGVPYRVDGLPTMYVLDREGRVLASAEGRLTEAQVVAVVEQALRP